MRGAISTTVSLHAPDTSSASESLTMIADAGTANNGSPGPRGGIDSEASGSRSGHRAPAAYSPSPDVQGLVTMDARPDSRYRGGSMPLGKRAPAVKEMPGMSTI